MERGAELGLDHDRGGLGDRMRHGDELDVERPDLVAMAERYDVQREIMEEPGLAELRLEHRGGEGRGIDGNAAEPWPQIDHGAEMILMRVGQEQPLEVRALGLEEGDVGKDHVDPRLGVAAKSEAQVDDEPLAVDG